MSIETVERTALVTTEPPTAIAPRRASVTSLQPRSFAELIQFAEHVSQSTFIPKSFVGRAGDIIAAVQYGAELGLPAMQALQSICVINGRPSLYGDAMLALVRNATNHIGHALMEAFDEGLLTDADGKTIGAWCESKRIGQPSRVTEFTLSDATQAHLINKPGPWSEYPKRMFMFRARAFNLRDNFGDVLKGLRCVEEVQDYPEDPEEDEPLNAPSKGVAGLKYRLQSKQAEERSKVTAADALAMFAKTAAECGFGPTDKKSLGALAKIICKKDTPLAIDLMAACDLGTPAWTEAIAEVTPKADPADTDPFAEMASDAQMEAIRAGCDRIHRDVIPFIMEEAGIAPEELTYTQATELLATLSKTA